MNIQPSRILNEKSGFLGLSIIDMAVLAYSLVALHSLLLPFGLEIVAFFFVGLIGYGLVAIRLRFRRKTIRDFIRWKCSSWRLQ
jgi:hypothetical protein